MAIKVAINGFGRIGRLVFRGLVERGILGEEVDLVAIVARNTKADYFVYQLTYDSAQHRWEHDLKTEKSDPSLEENDVIVIDGKHKVQCVLAGLEPKDLDWKALGVDYVIDSSGKFNDYDKAIELYPDFAKAYMNRSYANSMMGRRKESATDYKTA